MYGYIDSIFYDHQYLNYKKGFTKLLFIIFYVEKLTYAYAFRTNTNNAFPILYYTK